MFNTLRKLFTRERLYVIVNCLILAALFIIMMENGKQMEKELAAQRDAEMVNIQQEKMSNVD